MVPLFTATERFLLLGEICTTVSADSQMGTRKATRICRFESTLYVVLLLDLVQSTPFFDVDENLKPVCFATIYMLAFILSIKFTMYNNVNFNAAQQYTSQKLQ